MEPYDCSVSTANLMFFVTRLSLKIIFAAPTTGGPLVHKNAMTHEAECLIGIASTYLTSYDGARITSVFTSASEYRIYLGQIIEQLSSPSRCQVMK